MKHTKNQKMQRDPMARELVSGNLPPPGDWRDEFRHVAHQHVAIRFRNSNLICDLVDLSENGAKISVLDGAVPNENEELILTLFDGTAVEGRVSWLGENYVGIQFVNPVSDVDERLDFEDLGRDYFIKAVTLQKSTRRP
jgi:hypothetical protein